MSGLIDPVLPSVIENLDCVSKILGTLGKTLGTHVPFLILILFFILIIWLSLKPGYQTWILSSGLPLPPTLSLSLLRLPLLIRFKHTGAQ